MFYNIVTSVGGFFIKLFYRIKVDGLENIPENGNYIICPNHTSLLDPIMLSVVVKRQIRWMGKEELFRNKVLSFFLYKLGVFPVKRGEVDIKAIKTAFRVLKNDELLGLFPEGTRVEGFDLENAKPGASLISLKTNSKIIPVYIDSKFKLFSKVNITIGTPKNYFENYEEKINQKDHEVISKKLLEDIYSLKGEI